MNEGTLYSVQLPAEMPGMAMAFENCNFELHFIENKKVKYEATLAGVEMLKALQILQKHFCPLISQMCPYRGLLQKWKYLFHTFIFPFTLHWT